MTRLFGTCRLVFVNSANCLLYIHYSKSQTDFCAELVNAPASECFLTRPALIQVFHQKVFLIQSNAYTEAPMKIWRVFLFIYANVLKVWQSINPPIVFYTIQSDMFTSHSTNHSFLVLQQNDSHYELLRHHYCKTVTNLISEVSLNCEPKERFALIAHVAVNSKAVAAKPQQSNSNWLQKVVTRDKATRTLWPFSEAQTPVDYKLTVDS